jgi:hypothetical protein
MNGEPAIAPKRLGVLIKHSKVAVAAVTVGGEIDVLVERLAALDQAVVPSNVVPVADIDGCVVRRRRGTQSAETPVGCGRIPRASLLMQVLRPLIRRERACDSTLGFSKQARK